MDGVTAKSHEDALDTVDMMDGTRPTVSFQPFKRIVQLTDFLARLD